MVIEATLDPATLELTWHTAGLVPQLPRVPGTTHGIQEKPLKGDSIVPGPFDAVSSERTTVKLVLGRN